MLIPAGWTYQDKANGVRYSVSTTFRSNRPISYPVARAAWLSVRGNQHVRRCLLLAEILDWNDGGENGIDEEAVSNLALLLQGLSTNESEEQSDSDKSEK